MVGRERLSPSLGFQRKKTLLQEFRLRHKTGKFVDRRFGEYDKDLSLEEKAMQRFLLEKQVLFLSSLSLSLSLSLSQQSSYTYELFIN